MSDLTVPPPGRLQSEAAHLAWHDVLRTRHPELNLPPVTTRDADHLLAHGILAQEVNDAGQFFKSLPTSPQNSDPLHDLAHIAIHQWSNAQVEEPTEITHGSQVPTSPLVGLPDGWEPNAVVGSILSVSNGQTIEDIEVNGDVWLHDGSGGGRTDVHLNRVLIHGRIRCGYQGTPDDRMISNCEIDGSGNGSGELANVPCIDNAGYTVYRSILHKAKRGIVAEYNAAVIESWIKDTWGESYGGSNWDHRSLIGVGFDGEHHHITLQRNFIDGRTWAGHPGIGLSALLVMYDDPNEGTGPHDYLVEDNYWVGGDVSGYFAYLTKVFKPAANLVFRGNIYDRSSGQFCGKEGFLATVPHLTTDCVWENERWGPPTQAGWAPEGTLIASPW